MRPLEIVSVCVDHIPGRPSTASVELSGSVRLDQLQVWPARHGPLVLFPIGNSGHTFLELTPLVRSMVVRSVVAEWRRSLSARAAA
jgi:hypothetical protein